LSSCFDTEASYPLDNKTYTIQGEFLKNCEGEPVSSASLSLVAIRRSLQSDNDVISTTTTDLNGNFTFSYKDERRYSDLPAGYLVIRQELSDGRLETRSVYLSPYKNSKVNLIEEFKGTVYLVAKGLNNLTHTDTLFITARISGQIFNNLYYVGPFNDGAVLDSLFFRNQQGIGSYYWAIGDTNRRAGRPDVRHVGNYGGATMNVLYCGMSTINIDLSNTLK
tara:strand:+ start:1730 stop:2395 length:666 start_codon:yes stop_codon:yes gene_type:complete